MKPKPKNKEWQFADKERRIGKSQKAYNKSENREEEKRIWREIKSKK